MKAIGSASWSPTLLLLNLPALAQHDIRFDQSYYQIVPRQTYEVRVLADPVPASGLASYGVRLLFSPANAAAAGLSPIALTPPLDFNGVRGSSAVLGVGNGFAAAKGTVNFYTNPIPSYPGAVLATFSLTDLGGAPYVLSLEPFNTLGPTEQIFVDGAGTVLDPRITFGTAVVTYRPARDFYAIFAAQSNMPAGSRVLDFSGNNATVHGRIHSNSDINAVGNKHVFRNGLVEFVTGISPAPDFQGKVSLELSNLVSSTVKPYPLDYTLAEFAPGGATASAAEALGKYFHVQGDSVLDEYVKDRTLPEGLYYVEGSAHLSGSSLPGKVTIVATGGIHFSGNDCVLESFTRCLVAFSGEHAADYRTPALTFSGHDFQAQGAGKTKLPAGCSMS